MDDVDPIKEVLRAVMEEAIPLSEHFEYAGVIYEKDGKIHYTPPATNKERADVKVTVKYPKGAKLLGLYHTHPKGKYSEIISETDINVAKELGIPYYMGHFETGDVKVYEHGKTRIRKRRGQPLSSEGDLLFNIKLKAPFTKAIEESEKPSLSELFTGNK